MKILILPSWFPSRGNPLNGIFFKEQAEALAKYGHEVTIIDTSFHGRRDIFNRNNFRITRRIEEGVNIYTFKIPSFWILSRILPVSIIIYKALLFKVFKKLNPSGKQFDLIHAHSFYPAGYCASYLSRETGIPLFITEHNTDVLEKKLSANYLKILRQAILYSKRFICVSTGLRASIQQTVPEAQNLEVIPNIFSSDFTYLPNRQNDKSRDFLFLSVGFFNERKRHQFSISCFAEAFRHKDNVRFEIIGTGNLFEATQETIKNNGLENKVRLLGSLNKADLVTKMQECDAFILASTAENFGVVYVEAMACGKPVIATKNGGANDIVNPDNGILIDVDNREQLIEAFSYLYEHIEDFNPQRIATDCYNKYSEEAVIKKLTELYNQVLSTR